MLNCFCDRAPSVMSRRSVLSIRSRTSGTGWAGTASAGRGRGVREYRTRCQRLAGRNVGCLPHRRPGDRAGGGGSEPPLLRTRDRGDLILPAGVRARPVLRRAPSGWWPGGRSRSWGSRGSNSVCTLTTWPRAGLQSVPVSPGRALRAARAPGPTGLVSTPSSSRSSVANRPDERRLRGLLWCFIAMSGPCTSALGREGFEPSTSGLKVQPNKPRRTAARRNALRLRRIIAATTCAKAQQAEISLYVILYVMSVNTRGNTDGGRDNHARRGGTCGSMLASHRG